MYPPKHMMTILGVLMFLLSRTLYADVFSVGVMPEYDTQSTFSIWQPILTRLEKSTGHTFELISTDSYESFDNKLLNGEFDFVYVDALTWYVVNQKMAYRPLIMGSRPSQGIVVVPRSSGIDAVTQLHGKNMAFSDSNGLVSRLFSQYLLAKEIGAVVIPNYLPNDHAVFTSVSLGVMPAGLGSLQQFEKQSLDMRSHLRVIYRTTELPSNLIAVSERVAKKVSAKVSKTILALENSKQGKLFLSRIPMSVPIKADERDYVVLESPIFQAVLN